MGSLPLGGDLCRSWGWDYQLLKRCHHLRGSKQASHRRGTGPADDRYFNPAFRRVGDVIIESAQQARQHVPSQR
jgi:hypothetical protein